MSLKASLLEQCEKLSKSQFEKLLFGLEEKYPDVRGHISVSGTTRTERAIALIHFVEQDDNGLSALLSALRQQLGSTGPSAAIIRHPEDERLGQALDAPGDEGGGRDPWIVKTLDHVRQARPLRERLAAAGAPAVAVVEGCVDDLPNYLADDVFLDPWPGIDQIPQDATTLNPIRYGEDEHAFWSAVHHCLPAPQQARERSGERDAVRAWLRERERHLFYFSLGMVEDGWRLPRLIRAAQAFLAELSRCEPGMGLLLLIACQPRQVKPPCWWPLWRGWWRRRLRGEVLWLEHLRALERTDINAWYDTFSDDARHTWYRGRLRDELLSLFEDGHIEIHYRLARRHLLEGGALQRARSRP